MRVVQGKGPQNPKDTKSTKATKVTKSKISSKLKP
jgi:hypothetical protein